MAPAIALRGLRREFGDRAVLRDVSLTLAEGGTLAVVGPNGAGKTTLVRILATLLRPSAGEVEVLGCALPREAWRVRGRIGYAGHEPLLYRDLTVGENLRFHARLHGLERAEGERRAAELLEAVGMAAAAGEPARNLSAGMAQRVSVARALLHRPRLLLLDEPLAHLDPEGAALVEPLIAPAPGRTRVVVTHDPGAATAADRALALGHGGAAVHEGPAGSLTEAELAAVYRGAPR